MLTDSCIHTAFCVLVSFLLGLIGGWVLTGSAYADIRRLFKRGGKRRRCRHEDWFYVGPSHDRRKECSSCHAEI